MRLQSWMVCTLLILQLALAAQVYSKPGVNILAACASFAPDGSSAMATVETTNLSLELTDATGKIAQMKVPLRYEIAAASVPINRALSTCTVHFSHSSDSVAVGVGFRGFRRIDPTRLQVDVADVRTGKWIGNFGIETQPEFIPLSVAGFLEETNTLLVTGIRPTKAGDREQGRTFSSLQLTPQGDQLSRTATVREAPELTDALRSFVDAVHNRLWFFSCGFTRVKPYHVPLCPISATSLVGGETNSVRFDPTGYGKGRDDLWMWPEAFAAPDSDTVVIAETVSGKDTVWRVDVKKHIVDRLVLPKHHFVKYNGISDAALSPDGDVFGVLLRQVQVGFPYFIDNYVFRGTDILVFQLRPLRLLGVIPHKDSSLTTGLAVDHRHSKAIVSVYRQERFEHQEFSVPPS